jgi:hypothetical protein
MDMKTWLKLNGFKLVKKSIGQAFKSFERFKIAPLEAEIQLTKLQLKSHYHMRCDWNQMRRAL